MKIATPDNSGAESNTQKAQAGTPVLPKHPNVFARGEATKQSVLFSSPLTGEEKVRVKLRNAPHSYLSHKGREDNWKLLRPPWRIRNPIPGKYCLDTVLIADYGYDK
jgi:hypothetical protein